MDLTQSQPTAGTDEQSAPPSEAPSPPLAQRPVFEKRAKGSAHFEFSGTQRAAQNVIHKQTAETSLTALVQDSVVSGKVVSHRFRGEHSADVRYQSNKIDAQDELAVHVDENEPKWIEGQTKESIMKLKRRGLFSVWETYRQSGRNTSISALTSDTLEKDYANDAEGLNKLREFIVGYLAVTHGQDAG